MIIPLLAIAGTVLSLSTLPGKPFLGSSSERSPADDLEAALHATAGSGEAYGAIYIDEDDEQDGEAAEVWELFRQLEPELVGDDLLIGVILTGSTGTRSPVDVAREVLVDVRGDLSRIASSDLVERIVGLSPGGTARLEAAAELFRRANYRAATLQPQITSPDDVVSLLQSMAQGENERLVVVYVDRQHRVIGTRLLTKGSSAATVVDPRQILKAAIALGASGFILGHQHPSGNHTPSSQDIQSTKTVARAGREVGINLLDHVVVTPNGFSSLKELGYL